MIIYLITLLLFSFFTFFAGVAVGLNDTDVEGIDKVRCWGLGLTAIVLFMLLLALGVRT